MTDRELQLAYSDKVKDHQNKAKGAARKCALSVKWWRALARLADVLSILLAGFACASSAIALRDVVSAVTAGLAAMGAAFDATVRPGQLAARAKAEEGDWQRVVNLTKAKLDAFDGFDDAAAKSASADVTAKYEAVQARAWPKRSEYAPAPKETRCRRGNGAREPAQHSCGT